MYKLLNLQNLLIMVTITGYEPREKDGKTFFAITLQGEARMALSKETGNFYLTADKVSVTTALSEVMCQMLVGKQLPGSLQKVECEPYQYTNKETGEVLTLTSKTQYSPKEDNNVVRSANPTMQMHTAQTQAVPFGLVNPFTGEMAAA